MGDVVQLPARPVQGTRNTPAPRPSAVTNIEGAKRSSLNAALAQVGFDDHLSWLIQGSFCTKYRWRGIVTRPHIVATSSSNTIRTVCFRDGACPLVLSRREEAWARLDAWVMRHQAVAQGLELESWIVYADNNRFEPALQSPLTDAYARLALREIHHEGLDSVSTEEAARLVA